MSELDDFLTKSFPRQSKAEEAIHNGGSALRPKMWPTKKEGASMYSKLFRIALPFAAMIMILAACSASTPSPMPAAVAAPTIVAAATPVPPAATAIPSTATPAAKPQAAATGIPEMSGDFNVNGRSLYLKCLGTGSPAIVLEAGNAGTVTQMKDLQATLAKQTTTCAYSRANLGRSGSAPKPRTAKDVVDDLHALLAASKVPGPYLLVGQDAGGLFDQLYARTYPDQVVGVVAMNPQQAAHPWLDDISKIVTERQLADEKRSLDGGNEESIDYTTSSEQLAAAPQPPNVPFEMLVSPCDPGDQYCVKTYPTYKRIMQEVTAAWQRGAFSEVAGAEISSDNPDAVVAAVGRVLASK